MKKIIAASSLLVLAGCSSTPEFNHTPYSNEYQNLCYNVGVVLATNEHDKETASQMITNAEGYQDFDKDYCILVGRRGFTDTKEGTIYKESGTDWSGIGMNALKVVAVVLVAAGEVAQQQQAQQAEADRQFFDSLNRQREMENAVHNALQSRGY